MSEYVIQNHSDEEVEFSGRWGFAIPSQGVKIINQKEFYAFVDYFTAQYDIREREGRPHIAIGVIGDWVLDWS